MRADRVAGPRAGRPACATGGTCRVTDRKSTRLNSSHLVISYAVFCLKKKKNTPHQIGKRAARQEALEGQPAHQDQEHRRDQAHRSHGLRAANQTLASIQPKASLTRSV